MSNIINDTPEVPFSAYFMHFSVHTHASGQRDPARIANVVAQAPEVTKEQVKRQSTALALVAPRNRCYRDALTVGLPNSPFRSGASRRHVSRRRCSGRCDCKILADAERYQNVVL